MWCLSANLIDHSRQIPRTTQAKCYICSIISDHPDHCKISSSHNILIHHTMIGVLTIYFDAYPHIFLHEFIVNRTVLSMVVTLYCVSRRHEEDLHCIYLNCLIPNNACVIPGVLSCWVFWVKRTWNLNINVTCKCSKCHLADSCDTTKTPLHTPSARDITHFPPGN